MSLSGDLTASVLTETLTGTSSVTLEISDTDTISESVSETLPITATETLPHLSIVRHKGIFEKALQTGKPPEDRVILLELNADEFLLSRSAERGFFWRNTEIDVSQAPSLQPFLDTMWTQDSVYTNQSQFLTIVFYPAEGYRVLRYSPPEKVTVTILPTALKHQTKTLNRITFEIYGGTSQTPPPAPVEGRRIVERLDVSTFTMGSVGTLLSGSPMLPLHMGRINAISTLTACYGMKEDLSWLEHPTRLDMKSTLLVNEAYLGPYLGALVMNTALGAGIVIAHLAFVLFTMCNHCYAAEHQLWLYSMASAEFPSRSFGLMLIWWATIMKMAAVVLFNTTDSEAMAGAAFSFLAWLAFGLFVIWISGVAPMAARTRAANMPIRQRPSDYERHHKARKKEEKSEAEELKKGKKAELTGREPLPTSAFIEEDLKILPTTPAGSRRAMAESRKQEVDPFDTVAEPARTVRPLTRGLRRTFRAKEEWVDRLDHFPSPIYPKIARWVYFCPRFVFYFGDYTMPYHWYIAVDLLLTGVIGGLEGMGIAFNNCSAPLWAITGLTFLHLLAILRLQPYNAPIIAIFHTLMSLVEFTAALLGALNSEFDWLRVRQIAQLLNTVLLCFVLLEASLEALYFLYEIVVERIVAGRPWRETVSLLEHPEAALESGLLAEEEQEREMRTLAMMSPNGGRVLHPLLSVPRTERRSESRSPPRTGGPPPPPPPPVSTSPNGGKGSRADSSGLRKSSSVRIKGDHSADVDDRIDDRGRLETNRDREQRRRSRRHLRDDDDDPGRSNDRLPSSLKRSESAIERRERRRQKREEEAAAQAESYSYPPPQIRQSANGATRYSAAELAMMADDL